VGCTGPGAIERGGSLACGEDSAAKPGDTAPDGFGVPPRPGRRISRFLNGIGMLDLETSARIPNPRERRSRAVAAHACRSDAVESTGLGDLVGDGLTVYGEIMPLDLESTWLMRFSVEGGSECGYLTALSNIAAMALTALLSDFVGLD
jgi:hypothetical protein